MEYNSISDIHRAFISGELNPVNFAQRYLNRIEELDSTYHAWVSSDAEAVLAEAEKISKKNKREKGAR